MASWLNRIYREVDAEASRSDRAETPARRALLTGVFTSAAVVLIGLALMFLQGEPRPNEPPRARELIEGLIALRGVPLIYAGLLMLAATPILRVLALTATYLRRREWFMAGISLLVLLLLGLGVRLGTF